MTLELEQLVRRYIEDDEFDSIDFALEAEKLRPDKTIKFRTDIFAPRIKVPAHVFLETYLHDLERRVALGFTLIADRIDNSH